VVASSSTGTRIPWSLTPLETMMAIKEAQRRTKNTKKEKKKNQTKRKNLFFGKIERLSPTQEKVYPSFL
jgi:hypothetical protein